MLRRLIATACVVMALAAPAFADEPTPIWQHGHERPFKLVSDIEVGFLLGWDAKEAWWKTDARTRWSHVCRVGGTLGAVEIQKRIFDRPRPNRSDNFSLPSGHSAMAFTAARGWTYGIAVPIPIWRMAAGQHYLSDTLLGGAEGAAIRLLCDRFILDR